MAETECQGSQYALTRIDMPEQVLNISENVKNITLKDTVELL